MPNNDKPAPPPKLSDDTPLWLALLKLPFQALAAKLRRGGIPKD